MSEEEAARGHSRWAQLRFSVVGPLLASPPAVGELYCEFERLAQKPWRHPISGEMVSFGASTIERWYYAAGVGEGRGGGQGAVHPAFELELQAAPRQSGGRRRPARGAGSAAVLPDPAALHARPRLGQTAAGAAGGGGKPHTASPPRGGQRGGRARGWP